MDFRFSQNRGLHIESGGPSVQMTNDRTSQFNNFSVLFLGPPAQIHIFEIHPKIFIPFPKAHKTFPLHHHNGSGDPIGINVMFRMGKGIFHFAKEDPVNGTQPAGKREQGDKLPVGALFRTILPYLTARNNRILRPYANLFQHVEQGIRIDRGIRI